MAIICALPRWMKRARCCASTSCNWAGWACVTCTYSGDDLYLLAGPTMVLNGEIRLFKWPDARSVLAANQAPVRFQRELLTSVVLPHGEDSDRAEAICNLPRQLAGNTPSWLVLYDAPGAKRSGGDCVVYGDLLRNT